MPDALRVAAILLVAGPLLGVLGFYDRPLWGIWTASREVHLAAVATHRRGWMAVNAGFALATVFTSSGLAILAAAARVDDTTRAILAAIAVGYLVGGIMWCVVLGVRSRTTPRLGAMLAAGTPTEPTESLLGEALSGLFSVYCVTTSVALLVLGVTLAAAGIVAAPIAWLVAVAGALCLVWFFRAGDLIPAVLYLPTLVIGLALVGGIS